MECKKCKRSLPDGSKNRLCENCRGKRAQSIKNAGKAVIVIGGTIMSLAVVILTNGKAGSNGE